MELKKKRSGFTLLEIIIVIIIVGVLASLALPRFFSTVEYSRATEGLGGLQSLRGAMERCYLQTTDYTKCSTLADLDVGNPGTATNAHFTYANPTVAAPTGPYTFTATRNSIDGGIVTDTISISQDNANNTVTKGGTTAFGGVK